MWERKRKESKGHVGLGKGRTNNRDSRDEYKTGKAITKSNEKVK